MTTGQQHISVSVKAAIVRNGQILLVEYQFPDDLHYNLPGGKVRYGEGLRDAVARKVREETCAEIDVGRLLFVVEYVPERWDYEFGDYQKAQFQFACTLRPDSPEPRMPEDPDEGQTAVRWVDLDKLPDLVLLPKITEPLRAALADQAGRDALVDRW